MTPETKRRAAIQQILFILLQISALALGPFLAAAGELTEVADGPQFQLSLPDLDGQPMGLDELPGKVVMVNFWASWCPPCIEEMPSIQRLAEEMSEKPFAVIGINVGEAKRRVQWTVKRLGIDFPILLDKNSAVFKDWGATVLPTTYILDEDGRVRYIGRGPLEWDRVDIIDIINHLVEERPPQE